MILKGIFLFLFSTPQGKMGSGELRLVCGPEGALTHLFATTPHAARTARPNTRTTKIIQGAVNYFRERIEAMK
jgi:hypothetical protein